MLETQITPYGTETPEQLMDKFYQAGNEMLLTLRNYITSPDKRKKSRTWGAIEAAKMVGVSAPTFRKLLESDNEVPGIIIEENENGRKIKKYTLTAINNLREKAKTRYKRPKGSKPLTIAISNLKGGVGKTETAVDLGKKIAIEGLRSLLLDFDAQGTATLISSGLIPDLELRYEDTITNTLISDPNNIKNIVLKTHFDGFDIIPANLAIQDCDLILPNDKENNNDRLGSPFLRLAESLKIIKNQYDVILIDCGPNLGLLTLNAIIACDGMIIPIPPSMNDYSSFIMYTATLRNMFRELSNKKLDYLRILLSKHNSSNEALQMENMMREQFGRYILSNHMCETVEVSKAANEIGTIYDVSKPRGSREAYRRALQHLDDVNMEIINNFKDIWKRQVKVLTTLGETVNG
ncbi:chromosome partitioning protein ParA (plasmid) [Coxiella burnetii]|uniref:Plasmid partition protein A n=1 Tax=Coxiella burnetii (strain Dugway 5J108-111) TaxID=434922 RepID=A9KH95_COXBN|nr:AAA family ATPase [Coxiella burnetii]ABS78580.1 plasmid partition protein A [Coxiella burnetii Dugway 5J108-111]OYK79175.1 chromosome partitioning protein ParA [Coxiella burnetii]OYK81275.1 chromosome partitioning protein ParA [Coxiella burnetii]